MELTTELGCSYSLNGPDFNPIDHYNELNYGCRLANGVGILVLLVALLGYFTFYPFPKEEQQQQQQQPIQREEWLNSKDLRKDSTVEMK